MDIFSCKVVAAKFQTFLYNFYNNLIVKNSLHYVVVAQYLEIKEIYVLLFQNFKCSANIILYVLLISYIRSQTGRRETLPGAP